MHTARRLATPTGAGWLAMVCTLAAFGAGAGCGAGAAERRVEPALVGNDAVRARLVGLPSLPPTPATEVRHARMTELRAYCVWEARTLGGHDLDAQCPDGHTVHLAATCTDDDMRAMREGLSECALTVGEWAACVASRRASPCEGGELGERLPECEAFAGCIVAALAAAEADPE